MRIGVRFDQVLKAERFMFAGDVFKKTNSKQAEFCKAGAITEFKPGVMVDIDIKTEIKGLKI